MLSLAAFLFSILLFSMFIYWAPADIFLKPRTLAYSVRTKGAVFGYGYFILKNAFGGLQLLAGVVMLFTPGQGVLTIFMGLALVDFPRKQRLLLHLASKPSVKKALYRLRVKVKKEPFDLPDF